MTFYIKTFFVGLIILGALDFIWLGIIAKNFNAEQLQDLALMENGEFAPLKIPALITYLIMALALTVFAAPQIQNENLATCALYGALLGFSLYGVYEFTNLAILKNYPLKFALVDVAWGTFLYASANSGLFLLRRWLI